VKLLNLKPFVPSGGDFELARRFFIELGFSENWNAGEVCELQMGEVVFLLQDFENRTMQDNLMMYITVDDLDAFWAHLQQTGVLDRYEGARARAPTLFPWGNREVHLIDPAGVCWHFAE
jgi:uncharacterized glyoxalase superfamily protein PhnB